MEASGLPRWAAAAVDLLRWLARDNARLAAAPQIHLDIPSIDELRRRGIDSLYYWTLSGSGQSFVSESQRAEIPLQRVYDRVAAAQAEELVRINGALAEAGISFAVFKGAALSRRVRDGAAVGMAADLDILLPRSLVEEAKCALYALGYRQMIFDRQARMLIRRDVQEIAALEAQHYELVAFNRQVDFALTDAERQAASDFCKMPLWVFADAAALVLEVDLHHGIASDVDCEALLARRVVRQGLPTLCDADHLWFGLARYYNEVAIHGKRSLRDLAYLAPLVRFGEVDWGVFAQQTNDTMTHAPVSHLLGFLNALSGDSVPSEVFAAIKPTDDNRFRDWGSLLPQLFGMQDKVPAAIAERLEAR
ncbi:nucleotidyltransferase family protein [Falsiroseomonas ponticola]|uniref:nucleotidyltransferase family protein n=1 Tax=Falsiroseomonas ponticola TaxID=2786951 RepID=UPI0019334BBD|nr:nucleotidyltransferase family protein [Roseomonas ponticola]